jgi:hypothetical protein
MMVEEQNNDDRAKKRPKGADDQGYLISLNSTKFLAKILQHPQQKQDLEEDLNLIKSRYLRSLKILSSILILLAILLIVTAIFMFSVR